MNKFPIKKTLSVITFVIFAIILFLVFSSVLSVLKEKFSGYSDLIDGSNIQLEGSSLRLSQDNSTITITNSRNDKLYEIEILNKFAYKVFDLKGSMLLILATKDTNKIAGYAFAAIQYSEDQLKELDIFPDDYSCMLPDVVNKDIIVVHTDHTCEMIFGNNIDRWYDKRINIESL